MQHRRDPYAGGPPPPQAQQGPIQPLQDPTRNLVPILAKVWVWGWMARDRLARAGGCVHDGTYRHRRPGSFHPPTHPSYTNVPRTRQGTLNLARKYYLVSAMWIAGLILLAFFQGAVVPQDRLNAYDKVMRGIDHKQ